MTADRGAFTRTFPDAYFLDTSDRDGLTVFLQGAGWLASGESIRGVSRAGEGNMNLTVRVTTTSGSFILKQSRPWVEKYPQIEAPAERALQEGAFYELVATYPPAAGMMPRLLGFNRESLMLMLEDLGSAADYTSMYRGDAIDSVDLERLIAYLTALHGAFGEYPRKDAFANTAMRQLNHEHIFRLPVSSNDLDLDAITQGLRTLAAELRADPVYVAEVTRLGECYLAQGRALLHGDYFPGSWVKAQGTVKVIDPEFCFFGPPEFDVGVMLAHLILSGQKPGIVRRVLSVFEPDERFECVLAGRFAGVEIMRRLIGVAQLPLDTTLDRKRDWLARSRRLVCDPDPWESW